MTHTSTSEWKVWEIEWPIISSRKNEEVKEEQIEVPQKEEPLWTTTPKWVSFWEEDEVKIIENPPPQAPWIIKGETSLATTKAVKVQEE